MADLYVMTRLPDGSPTDGLNTRIVGPLTDRQASVVEEQLYGDFVLTLTATPFEEWTKQHEEILADLDDVDGTDAADFRNAVETANKEKVK